MKHFTQTLLFLLLLGVHVQISAQKTGFKFPVSVELFNADQQVISSSQLTTNDQLVFIDFWHTGCGPCMQMFDAVRDNIEIWNANTNCKIIAIACQEPNTKINALITSKKWPVEVYFDPEYALFKELCKLHDKNDMRFSFPTVFVFDKNWQLVDKLKGVKRKFKNGYLPQKNVKVTAEDFVIDLEYYYTLCKQWNSGS